MLDFILCLFQATSLCMGMKACVTSQFLIHLSFFDLFVSDRQVDGINLSGGLKLHLTRHGFIYFSVFDLFVSDHQSLFRSEAPVDWPPFHLPKIGLFQGISLCLGQKVLVTGHPFSYLSKFGLFHPFSYLSLFVSGHQPFWRSEASGDWPTFMPPLFVPGHQPVHRSEASGDWPPYQLPL